MAYTHSKYEVMVPSAVNLNLAGATGDKAYWDPGQVPHYVRGCALVITTSVTGTAGVVDFDYRPTAGSDTGRVSNGGVARLNVVNTLVAGNVLYKGADGGSTNNALNQLVKPGQEVVVKLTTAVGTAGVGTAILYVEPSWETPLNNSSMIYTT